MNKPTPECAYAYIDHRDWLFEIREIRRKTSFITFIEFAVFYKKPVDCEWRRFKNLRSYHEKADACAALEEYAKSRNMRKVEFNVEY